MKPYKFGKVFKLTTAWILGACILASCHSALAATKIAVKYPDAPNLTGSPGEDIVVTIVLNTGTDDCDSININLAYVDVDPIFGTLDMASRRLVAVSVEPLGPLLSWGYGIAVFSNVDHGTEISNPTGIATLGGYTLFSAINTADADIDIARFTFTVIDGAPNTSDAPTVANPAELLGSQNWNLRLNNRGDESRFRASEFDAVENGWFTVQGGVIPVNEPPVASFTTTINGLSVDFDASGSVDPDGSIVLYSWDFGDTNLDLGAAVTHEYLSDGTYTVTLIVEDNEGATDQMQLGINVASIPPPVPVAGFDSDVQDAVAGSVITFTDDSDPNGGNIVSWSWDFDNDGTEDSQDQNPIYIYDAEGVYTVSLTVTSDQGETDVEEKQDYITITAAPDVIEFITVLPLPRVTGAAPLTVEFEAVAEDTTGGSIVKYEWDFNNDGMYDYESFQATSVVEYTYTSAGSYAPSVRAINSEGLSMTYYIADENDVGIEVLPIGASPAIIGLTAEPNTGTAPFKVKFSVTTDNDSNIRKYLWDFDGNGKYERRSVQGANVVKTYARPGAYSAKVKVINEDGLSDVLDIVITVLDNANPPNALVNVTPDPEDLYRGDVLTFDHSANVADTIKYEYDFEGDGVIDEVVTELGTLVTHQYLTPGLYTATLTITDGSMVQSQTDVNIVVKDSSIDLASKNIIITTERDAFIRNKVMFTHNGIAEGLDSFAWDFDNNGDIDESNDINTAEYTYHTPGFYIVKTYLTSDADNLKMVIYTAITIDTEDVPCVWIAEPKDNSTISGNSVSIVLGKKPSTPENEFVFSYREQGGDGEWIQIDQTGSLYCRIDTIALADGDYDIRAQSVTDVDCSTRHITVTIDNSRVVGVAVNDTTISESAYIKESKVHRGMRNKIELFDKTEVVIPYGALRTLEDIIEVERLLQPPDTGVNYPDASPVDIYRQVSLVSGETVFNKNVFITIPYLDEDNDGIVDGTSIKEDTLDIYTSNGAPGVWKKLPGCVVFTDANIVQAKTHHFSFFGLGGNGGGIFGSSGNSSELGGCFIATASFGTMLEPEVKILCEFRDKYLLTNRPGQALVRFYYKHSPPVADYIRDKEGVKRAVRVFLRPLVEISKSLCK